MSDLTRRIADGDTSLFRSIEGQTTDGDRRTLLALLDTAAELGGAFGYAYLEIGSHMGGSLQPVVADDRCHRVMSIDPRPGSQPDERGFIAPYADNSTERMLEGLRRVPGFRPEALTTFECASSDLDPASLPARPDLCFIDGEHTDRAVVSDAAFCLAAIGDRPGIIAFHDLAIVFRGVRTVMRGLEEAGVPFVAATLPDSVFVVGVNGVDLDASALMREQRAAAWSAALGCLEANDVYRRMIVNSPIGALMRSRPGSWLYARAITTRRRARGLRT